MPKSKNQNQKVARSIISEDGSQFIINSNATEDLLEEEIKNEYNEKVDEYTDKLDAHANSLEEYAKQFNESIGDMEIKVINNNLLVMPYSQNPFQHIKTTESGILLNTGGLAPEYKSNESGEIEEEEQFIKVGPVIDAGPDCKWIKEGDVVMWTITGQTPIPFYNQNLWMIPEGKVLCVINSGLSERFKNN